MTLITAIMTIVACGNNGKAAEAVPNATDSDSVAIGVEAEVVEPIVFDSVVYTVSNKYLDYNVCLVYPKGGSDEVVRNMRRAILQNMGLKGATGDEDFNKVLAKNARQHTAEAKQGLEEMFAEIEDYDSDEMPKYSYEDDIRLEYLSPTYATFYSIGDDYKAGAHGMPWQYRFTVDLCTGKQLKWDNIFIPSAKAKLKPIIKRAVVDQYFGGDASMIDGFDLPGAEPALVKDGVWFGYGAYEIACYAAGMPECVISYDKLQDYLTDYVKEITNNR